MKDNFLRKKKCPFLKKNYQKNPTICCQFDQTQPKKHLAKKRFFRQREWLGSSPLHYSSISYRVGFSTLYTCIHPSQPPPTPLRFIVHGIFFIKSIIYQVGRSTCNITFNSQGVLSKRKKNTQLYRKKDFSASSCISNSRLRTVIDIKKMFVLTLDF